MASTSSAGSSSLRSASGSHPGVLDQTQPSRLLKEPNSTLSFATFDPTIAQAEPSRSAKYHGVETYRPKKIVIETTSQGARFWRFVPRARWAEGVQGEGAWPRIVEVCGEQVHFTEIQWDIYKLDPEYDCLVQASPQISIISKATSNSAPSQSYEELPTAKRRPLSPSADIPGPSKPKKQRARSSSITVSSDDEDVFMDDGPRTRTKTQHKSTKLHELHEKQRRERRERTLRTEAKRDHPLQDETMFSPTEEELPIEQPRFRSMPPWNASKRKVAAVVSSMLASQPIAEESGDDSDSRQPDTRTFKRTRTASPASARKTLQSKRAAREREKQARWSKIMQGRKKDMNQQFMHDILEEVPTSQNTATSETNSNQEMTDHSPNRPSPSPSLPDLGRDLPEHEITDEERERRIALAESIRKLQELEKDKPMWDEAAKKRKMRETAEEDELRAKAERRRQAATARAESERRVKAEREQQEARARAEAEMLEREATAKRAHDRRKQRQRWETGPWTTIRALDRYRALCESFDSTKYSPNDPLTFEDVPWPVLHAPGTFNIEDLDWAAVEKFFEMVKPYVRGDEYKSFVEKSHRRFHPDRWRSRRLLASILDEAEREELELAANVTAQALTPLWRGIK